MTYADAYNLRTTAVKFNDIADAIDGSISRQYAPITTGTSSAYIAIPTPEWQEYTTSSLIVITPHTTNAAGATIQINSLAAKALKIAGVGIGAGIIQAGVPTLLAYNGTHFEVLLQNISIPTGQVTAFAGSTSPTGWLLCDGTDYAFTDYPALHGVIGTTYNIGGEASNRFRVPDLRRRIPTGKGASDTLGNTEGNNKAGTAYASRSMAHSHTVPDHAHAIGTHTHTVNSHSHTVDSHSHTVNSHGHTAGSLRAQIGVDLGSATSGIAMALDGTNQWYSTYRWTASGVTTNSPNSNQNSTVIFGSTDTASPGTSSASPGTSSESPGTSAPTTSGVTGGVTAFSSEPTTQPYIFINYIIKT